MSILLHVCEATYQFVEVLYFTSKSVMNRLIYMAGVGTHEAARETPAAREAYVSRWKS